MPSSRRSFLTAVGLGGAPPLSVAFLAARGREAAMGASPAAAEAAAVEPAEIQIDSNENPLGPGPAAMEAFKRAFADAGRYPTNAQPSMGDLRDTIARRLSVRPENVGLGAGSGELLRMAVRLYTSSSRPWSPRPRRSSRRWTWRRISGCPSSGCPSTRTAASTSTRWPRPRAGRGSCSSATRTTPPSTVHSCKAVAEFVARVRRESPDTAILIDEAYHDYVTDPAYGTALAWPSRTRTCSSPARCPRPTAWRACASATSWARPARSRPSTAG